MTNDEGRCNECGKFMFKITPKGDQICKECLAKKNTISFKDTIRAIVKEVLKEEGLLNK